MSLPNGLGTEPRILLVTGAYAPEISAAGVQCRAAARALAGRARFSVLTTAVDPTLRPTEVIDGVTVHRVPINPRSGVSKLRASAALIVRLGHARHDFDLIHLHGFSQKNLPVTALGRLLGKPIVLTLHTAGQDEPKVVRGRGRLAYWAFTAPDLVLSVSPYMSERYAAGGLPRERLRLIPNGVDTNRFRPASAQERAAIRRELGWPEKSPVVLFVGFFSPDKRPDLLFRAWRRLVAGEKMDLTLVYVGATASRYYEVDEDLARQIATGARELGESGRLRFVGPTNDIERCLRAADIFVLPSIRESQSIALIEAMSCGLTAVASRLPGATDVLIEDGINGRLFDPDDEAALTSILREVVAHPDGMRGLGERARQTAVSGYHMGNVAEQWLAAYHAVLAGTHRNGAT